MNNLPEQYTAVPAERMKLFVSSLAQQAGMPQQKSIFLADLLVKNDLRGVFSHGSRQIATYARIMRDGLINPNPEVSIVNESPSTLLVDGDGGLGYFPAYRAAEALVEKCRACGIAVAVTRNHGHIGAAGIYSRILAERDLIGYVTSGHQLSLHPEKSIMQAAGGSPMSFAVPSGDSPAMVLDFGTMHDLYDDSPHRSEIIRLTPGLVFRSMGLGFMCQALGGFLAGVPVEEERAKRAYQGANQGSLIIALDIAKFTPLNDFKFEMSRYMQLTSEMQPLPGFDRATLPGVLEAERERDWAVHGIPVGKDHRDVLEKAAREFGVEVPF
ncbi:Ldh family oxidoreductase [Paenibacillus thermotolerans]|uniref:Ldh family oxidoreductase n=1 Tax=Paenibacillus thermotolerans TaxID=3027807 RepID=UPI002368470D|nr:MULTISPECIES: Ldh family oxidoreductase [unclassified Paenibacillus]